MDNSPLILRERHEEKDTNLDDPPSEINKKSMLSSSVNSNLNEQRTRGNLNLKYPNKTSPIDIPGGVARVKEESRSSRGRMSLFKAFTRRTQSGATKHKKLNESWVNNGNWEPQVIDGVTFGVKFLGSALVGKVGSAEAAEATKTVIQMVKAGKKTSRVGLTVSTSGITIMDASTGEITSEISIYDIAHCSTDANFPTVFSFIATNKNETNECYCFASRKRKLAQKATLTIAEAFQLAFEIWQNSSAEKQSPAILNSGNHSSRHWVHFDEDLEEVNDHLEKIDLDRGSPRSPHLS